MDKEALQGLLAGALKARTELFDERHEAAFRLFNGFYEGCPDLVLDVYARTLVIHNYADPPENGLGKTDFYFIEQEDPERVLKIILELAVNRIPDRFGLNTFDDIQILTPMHKGIVGATNLNLELQNAVNPGKTGITRGNNAFRVNDKVMQIKNNYDKSVFNGDIGRIRRIDTINQEVNILIDEQDVTYDFSELDEITLAYAISVHKSQGSEYAAVVMPVLTQHFILLQRNLIYTAVTRGRQLVVLVGTQKALTIGIKNNKTTRRFTHLQQRIKQNFLDFP